MSVILYDELGGSPGTTGTWSYTGVPSPNPAAPVTYDGAVDFTGYDPGDYEYTYTIKDTNDVCTDTATVTVEVTEGVVPPGDLRVLPIITDTLTGIDTLTLTGQTFLASCPGFLAPELGDLAIPTSWIETYSGDLFYRIPVSNPSGTAEQITVTVTSSGVTDPLLNPYAALYTGTTAGTIVDDSGPSNANTVSVSYTDVAGLSGSYYLRVGAVTGSEGNFSLLVVTQ